MENVADDYATGTDLRQEGFQTFSGPRNMSARRRRIYAAFGRVLLSTRCFENVLA